MLETSLRDLLGSEYPILQAAIWSATAPELVAAGPHAGGIGSLGAVFIPADELSRRIARVRELTDRPFVVNHVVPLLIEEAFAVTLDAKPAMTSLPLAVPGDLVSLTHDVGVQVIHQVHTVVQAREGTAAGVDSIIA